MSVHPQFDEDLALFALGELTGERRLAVEKHVEECPECRRELEQVWGDLALLALSAEGPKPPARARERLMAAIEKEPRRTQPIRTAPHRNWWRPLEWVLGAAAVVVIAVLLIQNADLKKQIGGVEVQSATQQQQLAEARELMTSLASPDAEHFSLTTSKTPPQPQAKVLYVRGSGSLVLLASHMAPLAAEKTYELWLIPATGAPIPAGLFKPGPDGSATLIKPPLPAGVEAQTFAISVEPEAGSPAPTSTPIMVASKG
jgi:anti-sigma-K factor RskA